MKYVMWINGAPAYSRRMKMRPCLTLALMLLSAAAWAQYTGEAATLPAPRADFVALDHDRDGRLSEAEYAAAMEDNQKRIFQDSVITARVKAALLAERGIPSLSISVETYEGSVQLTGFVNAPEIVSRAGRVTAGVNGVRTVHNNIGVR